MLKPFLAALAATFLVATSALASSDAPLRVSPLWMELKLASALEIGGVERADADAERGTVNLPEPPESGGRISVSHGGGHSNRRRFDDRRLGIGILPGWSILQGEVVGKSFGPGPVITLRLLVNASSANQFFFDLSYSNHPMRDPRPMFFRTSVTSASSFSGKMDVICPAIFYAATIPIGADFHHKAYVVPKLFLGLGPMISLASGHVTNAGSKGNVSGSGTQPFLQFTPGLAVDVRVMDFLFIGPEIKYRITVPTSRPNEPKEFSIPKMYVFEAALSASYFFW